MPRTVRDSRLETRTARARLGVRHEPYWKSIDGGMHIGYRKGRRKSSWLARYRTKDGKYLKTVLAGIPDDNQDADGSQILSYSEAQAKARDWFATQGRNETGDDAAVGSYTVTMAMRDYLSWYAVHRKSLRDVELRTDKFILPRLGHIELDQLTARKIRNWHEDLTKGPPMVRTGRGRPQNYREPSDDPDYRRRRQATANHVLTILKAALNHAWRDGRVQSDEAWRRVQPFRGVEAPRIRYLSVDELRRLLNASEPDFRGLVRAALLTGCRYGELTAMRCDDFDPDARAVHVRISKSGKARSVPLTDEGFQFFADTTAGRGGDDIMLRRADGKQWGKSHQRRRMADAAEIAKVPDVSFHSLRHAYASGLAMNETPMRVIAEVLGHADTRICEKHYAHLAPSYVADTIRAKLRPVGVTVEGNVARLDRDR